MTPNKYSDKLKDPRWAKKRKEILCRDANVCADCYTHNAPMHVHHIYYEYGFQPWEYPDDAYLTLCDKCHEIEHERFRSYVGPSRVMSLKKLGFRAKDYETLCFSYVGIVAGFFDTKHAIDMCLKNIRRRREHHNHIINLRRNEIGLEQYSEWE